MVAAHCNGTYTFPDVVEPEWTGCPKCGTSTVPPLQRVSDMTIFSSKTLHQCKYVGLVCKAPGCGHVVQVDGKEAGFLVVNTEVGAGGLSKTDAEDVSMCINAFSLIRIIVYTVNYLILCFLFIAVRISSQFVVRLAVRIFGERPIIL